MDFERHNTVFLRQRLPVDSPEFNVEVPRNENRSHRLNTTLRAMVEIAGETSSRTETKERCQEKAPDRQHDIGIISLDNERIRLSRHEAGLRISLLKKELLCFNSKGSS